MSSDGVRESQNGGGDLSRESQTVTGSKGNDWFVIWERGETGTHVGVLVDGNYPKNLEDWQ